ncbi:uncharacterized protein [Physcomitrium patens]|uniref:uncharacterized protein isoform X5 n=1 Tax=Physcomitrium patens TaxID=3218 RepID=UPI003CCE3C8D
MEMVLQFLRNSRVNDVFPPAPCREKFHGYDEVVFASQDAAYYVEKNVFDIPYSTIRVMCY